MTSLPQKSQNVELNNTYSATAQQAVLVSSQSLIPLPKSCPPRLSNEVFKDLIPQGSSQILVPQTPGIKIWSPQNSPSSSTFPGGPEEQNQA